MLELPFNNFYTATTIEGYPHAWDPSKDWAEGDVAAYYAGAVIYDIRDSLIFLYSNYY